MAKKTPPLRVIPLGGHDGIGKHMTAIECGPDIVLIDAGLMFPDDSQPGIDLVLPDYTYVLENADRLRGIVIEPFGAGNIPGDGGALRPIIEMAFLIGTVLTVCSQCPQGAVALGAYETSNALKRAGAVSGLDMTTEAAVAKLYYLFSCSYDKEKIKQAMEEDLRGEISVS